MKLTEIAIEGYGVAHNLRLGRFNDGLNFIYGENGAGKTTLRKFIQGVFFGFDRNLQLFSGSVENLRYGRILVQRGSEEYSIERDTRDPNLVRQLRVSGPSVLEPDQVPSASYFTGDIDQELYETVFSFSLRETCQNAGRLAAVMQNQLSIGRGPAAAGDDGSYRAWQREAESRQSTLTALRQNIEHLENEKAKWQREIDAAESLRRTRLADLESQIRSAANHPDQSELLQRRNELASVDREIFELRAAIDSAVRQVTYVPRLPETDPYSALYQRLDEIDNQIRRWRRVQSDIQTQRVRLKDEMVVWNDLTLDSSEHPYHNAREILLALENKVDQAEKQSASWRHSTNHGGDPVQQVQKIQDLCKLMKDDLYGLCQELAQQYKHIRHKAAAAELKQLRRCYNEMGENTQRLVQRRDELINEIRKVDPAGADAIVRSDVGFCQCALHEGYLEARKKHVVAMPDRPQPQVTHQVIPPDLSAERRRLESLHHQRQQITSWLANAERSLETWRSRLADLNRQREALNVLPDHTELNQQIHRTESELIRLRQEVAALSQLIDRDRHYNVPNPHPVLVEAAKLLKRVTNGELIQVYLNDALNTNDLQIRNQIGKVLNFSALDAEQQDLVYLSVIFAIKNALQAREIDAPIIIDDAFANISRDRVNLALDLFTELCFKGHQVILLTQHQYLADRVPGTPVFELPPMTSFPQPMAQPDRTSKNPILPTRDSSYSSSLQSSYEKEYLSEFDFGAPFPTYPISKYPLAPPVDFAEPADFIVPDPVVSNPMDARFPDPQLRPYASEQYSPVSVEAVGDQLGYSTGVDENTALERIDVVDTHQLHALAESGVETVEHLLNLDPGKLPLILSERGIVPEQVDRWQSQVWLLSNVPGLRVIDSKLLVACGITEPVHLATSHAQQLFERIQRFLGSSEGQRFAAAVNSISLQRINGWYHALNSTRARWSSNSGLGRRPGYPKCNSSQQSRSASWESKTDRTENGPRLLRESDNSTFGNSRNRPNTREPMVARSPRMRTPERTTSAPALAPAAGRQQERDGSSGKKTKTSKLRFYLDLNDHIEAAPSIGPKTAERFEKIGVSTLADFLKQTAESISAKLNYKRITAELVRDWQHQARLVCRIPNLRGHDAQLLVACGYTEAEEIATLQPQSLFDVIRPFADTKDGMKIIRNGRKPDLEEITNWITWAGDTRSLQAA